jgi:sRNA-binding protein
MLGKQDHNEVIAKLAEEFPRAFFIDSRQRRPLKKNILADIEARDLKTFDGFDIKAALDWYKSNYGY